MTLLGKIFAGIGLALASLFGIHQTTQNQVFGDYNPAGGGTYRLQSSIGSSDTSITLSTFKEPVSNIAYTMSYLNSTIEYGTLEPGNSSKKEFISFSGITQNSDGTATLTGVTRGLSFAYPYTASTTLQQTHSGQSIFILSNPPQLTNQYANLNNANTFSKVVTFTAGQNPTYTSVPGTFASTDLVPYQTLLNTAIAGAATSTETNMGIVQLATKAQTAAGTASSTEGRPLVIKNSQATTTYNPATAANVIPVTGSGGTISNLFVATSTGNNYSWGGNHTFTSGLLATASSTFTATTSIQASSTTTAPLILNGIPCAFPSTQGASSTVLMNDGGCNLTWQLATSTYAAGIMTATSTTGGATSGNNDAVQTIGFKPSFVKLYYYILGHTATGGTNVTNAEKGTVLYNTAGTIIFHNILYSNTSGTLAIGDLTNSSAPVDSTTAPQTGSAGASGAIQGTLSIPSVSSTGFTIRTAFAGTGGNTGSANVSWEAWK